MNDIKSVIRARDELARIVGLREAEISEIHERLDKIAEYISSIDGLPGSTMWRIRTDIQAILGMK